MQFVKPLKLFHFIIYLGLAILPFVYWPLAQIPYEIPRIFFVHRFIEILAILGLFALFSTKITPRNIRQIVLVIGFFTFISLSAVFGVDFPKSLLGNMYRGDGLITYWRFGGFVLLIGILFHVSRRISISYSIAIGSVGVSLLTTIAILLNLLHISFFPPWYGKFGTTFGQPHFLAGYLAVTFPFLLYLHMQLPRSMKLICKTAIVIQSVALLSTQSWGALLATVFGLAIYYVLNTKRPLRSIISNIIGIMVVTFCVTSLLWVGKNRLPVSMNAESRQRIFTKLMLASAEKPLLGWGWANVDYAFTAIDWPYKFSQDVYVDKAHSTMLEMAVTTGITGLIIYIVLMLHTFHIFRKNYLATSQQKQWWSALGICLLIYTFHSQTNVVGIAEECIFWLLIGFSLQPANKDRTHTNYTHI